MGKKGAELEGKEGYVVESNESKLKVRVVKDNAIITVDTSQVKVISSFTDPIIPVTKNIAFNQYKQRQQAKEEY